MTVAVRPSMTERELLIVVVECAAWLGWRCFHPWTAIRSAAGYPDLTLCHVGQRRIIFAELKAPRGRLTPDQDAWLQDLREAGAEVYVWTPSSWLDGTIETILRERF